MKKYVALVALMICGPANAIQAPETRQMLEAQAEALKPFDWMTGEWRGAAVYQTPEGAIQLVQTERVGPLLGGSVRVVEGRGYLPDGSTGFNALAVIHFDPVTKAYSLSSFAEGRKGVFPITPVSGGFDWEIAAGPATIRYQARLRDGKWIETGERIMSGRPPMRFFEMTLERIGVGTWPAGTPVARN